MKLTLAQLKRIMPKAGSRAGVFLDHLNTYMPAYDINTPARAASFLSQIGHESLQLFYTEEIASGIRYEGRKDLGNVFPGDGVRYKGRGLIQITGRANYTACMMDLEIDCLEHPELLELPKFAVMTACWFWKVHGLNQLADLGDQTKVTKRVNGGHNGLEERLALFAVAQKELA